MQSFEALQTVNAEPIQGTRHARIYENGISVVDLIGPIFPRANMMTMSGAVSIAQFTQDFVKAEAMASVAGVIINIDSPGGDVRGIGDAAKIVNAVRRSSDKPIKAFVSGYMASAAYYVGSAVGPDNIISTESGLIGSIGVVLTAKGKTKDEIEIVSSQSPYKRTDPNTPEGREPLQQQVDDLADIFVRDVKTYRGVSSKKVLSDYGQGSVYVGPRALTQGLVDRIGTLSEVVDEMASGTMKPRRSRTKASDETSVESLLQFSDGDDTMPLKDMIARFRTSDESLVEGLDSEQDATAAGAAIETPPAVASTDPAQAPEPIQTKGPTREELEERFSDGAELFASQMVTSHKLFPAQASYAASDLLTARIDDVIIGGKVNFVNGEGQIAEGTREEQVRARYSAMPAHTMTQKAVSGIKDGSVAAVVLAETNKKSTDDDTVTADRKAALLNSSIQGQTVIANAQKG